VFTLEKKNITRVSLLFWLLPSDKLTTLAFYHSTFPNELLRKKTFGMILHNKQQLEEKQIIESNGTLWI
jgi:hypothetical protein